MAEEIVDADSSHNLFTRLVDCTLCYHDSLQSHGFDDEGFSYEVLDTIGEGGFARVYRCRHSTTGDIVAIKQIDFSHEKIGVPSSVIREISLLRELDHVNIVRLLKVLSKETYVNLVFEPLDQDLRTYIRDKGGVTDPLIRKNFMRQILTGVAYCHARKVLHRDLKPNNLLIDDSRMIIKIADFGLAREFGGDMLLTRHPATRYYRAPEVLLGSQHYSTGIDLWSVGCIFGEMVIGKPIFGATDTPDELDTIFRMLGTPSEKTWPGITEFPLFESYAIHNPVNLGKLLNLTLLCYRALVKDLSTVFSALEPEGRQLLKMLLCLDPKGRISAEAALKHAYFNDQSESS